MPDPDSPARQSPYIGGINTTYPGSAQSPSTTKLPLILSGTQGKGFARGWLRPLVAYLTGRKSTEAGTVPLTKPSGERGMVMRTDRDLQTGPSPIGITRLHNRKIGGISGAGDVNFLSPGGFTYIPHQNINRRDAGKAIPNPARKFDDNVTIPAIYAGNQNRG